MEILASSKTDKKATITGTFAPKSSRKDVASFLIDPSQIDLSKPIEPRQKDQAKGPGNAKSKSIVTFSIHEAL